MGNTAPPAPGHVFTISEWINHHEATHHPGDPVMGHTEKLANGRATCIEVVEEWHKWLFRIPAAYSSKSCATFESIQNRI